MCKSIGIEEKQISILMLFYFHLVRVEWSIIIKEKPKDKELAKWIVHLKPKKAGSIIV